MGTESKKKKLSDKITPFDRKFFDAKEDFTFIGSGSLGGKATGLAEIKDILEKNFRDSDFPGISLNIPRLVVITTNMFDIFLRINDLYDIAYSDESDEVIAHKFINASLPVELLGDLRALIEKIHTPLAVRSSSLLEDALYEPFAGIYGTKMIPNNQFDADTRFHKLVEAIKFVYASTFFKDAKDYIRATNNDIKEEKMAVIIQEVVGERFGDFYFPLISGVARSYNFYPAGRAKPENGIVNLALGLGKTVVDGEPVWNYSPEYPSLKPPFGSINDMMKNTQREFWSVNMGKAPDYDPIHETEYLLKKDLTVVEEFGILDNIVSTYDAASDRLKLGTGYNGPRVIDFAPVLELNTIPLNSVIKKVLKVCEESAGNPVEVEFAVTHNQKDGTARFGFLQVRPMVVSNENVSVTDEDFNSPDLLVSSDAVLGNGTVDTLKDIVFVKPDVFDIKHSNVIASEIEIINKILKEENRKYLLIGFGRWGSSEAWLGIPVNWGQISEASVIVESMLEGINVELSQGSHFFHNITSFRVMYFSLQAGADRATDWNWINGQTTKNETHFIKHVETSAPLRIKVDGKKGKGVILR